MENQSVEQISDVPHAAPLAESRVRNTKKVAIKIKSCIYFKDMDCRAPVCDMDICEKCPEGGAVCLKINFIKRMISRILALFVSFLFLSELL